MTNCENCILLLFLNSRNRPKFKTLGDSTVVCLPCILTNTSLLDLTETFTKPRSHKGFKAFFVSFSVTTCVTPVNMKSHYISIVSFMPSFFLFLPLFSVLY